MCPDPFHPDAAFAAAGLIRARGPRAAPRVALILGSGLGMLAGRIEAPLAIPYAELPGFPRSSVAGHAGELVLGELAGVPVACLKGRGHFYEGQGLDVMNVAVRTMKLLGCEILFATNAVGSLRRRSPPGSLVMVTDHLSLLPGSPLAGPNDDRFGPRFVSMADAYDRELRALLRATAAEDGIALAEGVYCCCPGPSFETAAEVRMLDRLGADTVGMSVVPEAIVARHCGMRVAAVSVVTNLAEGLTDVPLSHEQTLHCAARGAGQLGALVLGFLARIGAHATA